MLTLLYFILAISLLVVIHEYGPFLGGAPLWRARVAFFRWLWQATVVVP